MEVGGTSVLLEYERRRVLHNMSRTRSTSSSAVNGRPLDVCLHRHPVSVNCLYHARMFLSVGGFFAYFARNARCTVTTDLLVWYSNTQKDFSPGAAIFSLHTLASPSGRNVNHDEKQHWKKKLSFSFYLYRFRKYVSCGFPIINFCNPGVHYETPCIMKGFIILFFTDGRWSLNEWYRRATYMWKCKLHTYVSRHPCYEESTSEA